MAVTLDGAYSDLRAMRDSVRDKRILGLRLVTTKHNESKRVTNGVVFTHIFHLSQHIQPLTENKTEGFISTGAAIVGR